jgi:hypothetical protein
MPMGNSKEASSSSSFLDAAHLALGHICHFVPMPYSKELSCEPRQWFATWLIGPPKRRAAIAARLYLGLGA